MLIGIQREMGIHIDNELFRLFKVGIDKWIFTLIDGGIPDLRPTE